jgi:hypothetical protein
MNSTSPVSKALFLQVADFIAANPELYQFAESEIPRTCRSPGCVIGWLHHFSKMPGEGTPAGLEMIEAYNVLGISDTEFYNRMEQICLERLGKRVLWMHKAEACATVMRAYAEEYFPAPTTDTGAKS